ncbi:MAG: hypothetical protein K2J11_07075 [Oscillospiraceae bacterium]|nr:hypothetical protein [Oscillospiraceae bacterium]
MDKKQNILPEIRMKEKTQNFFKIIYFVLKVILYGAAFLFAFQLIMSMLINQQETEKYGETMFYGHYYSGTFFIEMTAEYTKDGFSEASAEHTVTGDMLNIAGIGLLTAGIVCLFIVIRNASKGKLYTKSSYLTLFISSGCFLFGTAAGELLVSKDISVMTEYAVGIFSTASYNFRPFYILALPSTVLAGGMVLRYILTADKQKMRIGFKIFGTGLFVCAAAYLIWKGIFHAGSLISLFRNGGKNMAVRIPFYNIYMDLPSDSANSPEAYARLVIFRFFKELPVTASAVISLVMMGKVMISYSGEIVNAKANRRFIRIAVISLAVASLLYNLLGIAEVNMLHEAFSGLYGNAYYTIAVRGLCEPLVYALYIFVFGVISNADEKIYR